MIGGIIGVIRAVASLLNLVLTWVREWTLLDQGRRLQELDARRAQEKAKNEADLQDEETAALHKTDPGDTAFLQEYKRDDP